MRDLPDAGAWKREPTYYSTSEVTHRLNQLLDWSGTATNLPALLVARRIVLKEIEGSSHRHLMTRRAETTLLEPAFQPFHPGRIRGRIIRWEIRREHYIEVNPVWMVKGLNQPAIAMAIEILTLVHSPVQAGASACQDHQHKYLSHRPLPGLLPRRAGIVAVVPPPFHPRSCWPGVRRTGGSCPPAISMCNQGEDRVNLDPRTGESTRLIIKLVPQPGRKNPGSAQRRSRHDSGAVALGNSQWSPASLLAFVQNLIEQHLIEQQKRPE